MLYDTHCHLDYIIDNGGDIESVLKQCELNDVSLMNTIGTDLNKVEIIFDIVNKYNNVYCTIGTHPEHAIQCDKYSTEDIIQLCKSNKKIIGIGETGLDFSREHNKEKQMKSFTNHLDAANELSLPVVIHNRESDRKMLEILSSYKQQTKRSMSGVIHCFTGDKYLAKQFLDLGYYISFSGIVTFKNAVDIQDAVKYVPKDRILIETDSPFLAPVPFRGKQNYPYLIKHIAIFMADLLSIKYETVADLSMKNGQRLFNVTSYL